MYFANRCPRFPRCPRSRKFRRFYPFCLSCLYFHFLSIFFDLFKSVNFVDYNFRRFWSIPSIIRVRPLCRFRQLLSIFVYFCQFRQLLSIFVYFVIFVNICLIFVNFVDFVNSLKFRRLCQVGQLCHFR